MDPTHHIVLSLTFFSHLPFCPSPSPPPLFQLSLSSSPLLCLLLALIYDPFRFLVSLFCPRLNQQRLLLACLPGVPVLIKRAVHCLHGVTIHLSERKWGTTLFSETSPHPPTHTNIHTSLYLNCMKILFSFSIKSHTLSEELQVEFGSKNLISRNQIKFLSPLH